MRIKGRLKVISNRLIETVSIVFSGIANIKNNTLYGLGMLSSALAVVISSIGAIVAYIRFIMQGGYEKQIEYVKNGNIDGATSDGTAYMLFNGGMVALLTILLVISFICLLICFFKSTLGVKKIIIIADLLMTVLIVLFFFVLHVNTIGTKFIDQVGSENFEYMLWITLAICALIIISFCYVMLHSQCREMFQCIYRMAITVYLFIPIGLYIVENIITTFVYIITIVIIGALICFLFTALIGGENSDNVGKVSSSKSEEIEKSPQPKVIEFSGNHVFYRGKGGYGVSTPTSDCIYQDGALAQHSYVCTVEAYEKGKVIIMLNGKRVTGI